MAFLDIEQIIKEDNIGSRFKLVKLAAIRARELNSPTDTTIDPELKPGEKVTTKALTDLIDHKIGFVEVTEEEGDESNNE